MPVLVNQTAHDAFSDVGIEQDGAARAVVVVSANFALPPPGKSAKGHLRLCEVQTPAARQDVYFGPPGASSLRREGQSGSTRPGTDVYLLGHAWTPGGRPSREATVALSVGSRTRRARIVGPRRWLQGVGTPRAERPEAFSSVELCYERCAGGPFEPRNPVGCGVYRSAREAVGEPLPQIEDEQDPLEAWSDRPVPAGFGPIARSWQPRLAYAGTFDDTWREERAPLWPKDLDPRFFHAAAPELCFTPRLRGGESVCLRGCHPDGDYLFDLPRIAFSVRTYYRRAPMHSQALRLDAVELDADARSVQLVWRAAVPLPGGLFELEASVLAEDRP